MVKLVFECAMQFLWSVVQTQLKANHSFTVKEPGSSLNHS